MTRERMLNTDLLAKRRDIAKLKQIKHLVCVIVVLE
jgi:hypothetical protein